MATVVDLARGSGFPLRAQWSRNEANGSHRTEYVQPLTRSRSHHRLSRGVREAAHAPDARAPALRAGARSGRRADPRRLRRRSAAAAPRSRHAISTTHIEQFAARPAERARADGGVPPRAADGGAARAERAAAGSAGGRHPRRHPPAAEDRTRRSCSPSRASRGSTSSSTSRTASRKVPPSGAGSAGADGVAATPKPAAATTAPATARDPLGRLLRAT